MTNKVRLKIEQIAAELAGTHTPEKLREWYQMLSELRSIVEPPEGSETANLFDNLQAVVRSAIHRAVDEEIASIG